MTDGFGASFEAIQPPANVHAGALPKYEWEDPSAEQARTWATDSKHILIEHGYDPYLRKVESKACMQYRAKFVPAPLALDADHGNSDKVIAKAELIASIEFSNAANAEMHEAIIREVSAKLLAALAKSMEHKAPNRLRALTIKHTVGDATDSFAMFNELEQLHTSRVDSHDREEHLEYVQAMGKKPLDEGAAATEFSARTAELTRFRLPYLRHKIEGEELSELWLKFMPHALVSDRRNLTEELKRDGKLGDPAHVQERIVSIMRDAHKVSAEQAATAHAKAAFNASVQAAAAAIAATNAKHAKGAVAAAPAAAVSDEANAAAGGKRNTPESYKLPDGEKCASGTCGYRHGKGKVCWRDPRVTGPVDRPKRGNMGKLLADRAANALRMGVKLEDLLWTDGTICTAEMCTAALAHVDSAMGAQLGVAQLAFGAQQVGSQQASSPLSMFGTFANVCSEVGVTGVSTPTSVTASEVLKLFATNFEDEFGGCVDCEDGSFDYVADALASESPVHAPALVASPAAPAPFVASPAAPAEPMAHFVVWGACAEHRGYFSCPRHDTRAFLDIVQPHVDAQNAVNGMGICMGAAQGIYTYDDAQQRLSTYEAASLAMAVPLPAPPARAPPPAAPPPAPPALAADDLMAVRSANGVASSELQYAVPVPTRDEVTGEPRELVMQRVATLASAPPHVPSLFPRVATLASAPPPVPASAPLAGSALSSCARGGILFLAVALLATLTRADACDVIDSTPACTLAGAASYPCAERAYHPALQPGGWLGGWSDPGLCWHTTARFERAQAVAARIGAPPIPTFASLSWPSLFVHVALAATVLVPLFANAYWSAASAAASTLSFYRSCRLKHTASQVAYYGNLASITTPIPPGPAG